MGELDLKQKHKDSYAPYVSAMPSGTRLSELSDIITRVCLRESVVPPALAMYCCRRAHYRVESQTIMLSHDAVFTVAFPSTLYHELAHHLAYMVYNKTGHGVVFYGVLFSILKEENMIKDYLWSHEYKIGIKYAKKIDLLPKDFSIKKWASLQEYINDHPPF